VVEVTLVVVVKRVGGVGGAVGGVGGAVCTSTR
jgi:hypothetical protein